MVNQKVKIRVLIADNDIDFCYVCSSQIAMTDDIICCGVAYDGREAVQKIIDTQPDVVVLDFNLPVLDGPGVMECILSDENAPKPKFIAVSTSSQGVITNLMLNSGASYCLVKPYNVDVFISRIRMVVSSNLFSYDLIIDQDKTNSVDTLKKTVLKHVLALGVSTKLIGFVYIQAIISELIENKSIRPTLSQVYKNVADKHETDSRCVENAVTGAIKSAMNNKTDAMKELLQLSNCKEHNTISNGKFLSLAVENIKLNML